MEKQTSWKCPKCGRQFEKKNQAHSCKLFPFEQHFEGKPEGKLLYDYLKKTINNQIGEFKIESLACCIHLVTRFTFATVHIFKQKIQIHFSLNLLIESSRIQQFYKIAESKYFHIVDIATVQQIDEELISWIKEAENIYEVK